MDVASARTDSRIAELLGRDDELAQLFDLIDGIEQRGLPDPGFAAHDERAAAPPDSIDQVVKLSQLVVSAEKLGDSQVGARASQVDLRLLRRQRYNVRSEVQSNDLSDARHLALSSRSG